MHLLMLANLLAWLIALIWMRRSLAALRNLPKLPDLLDEKYSRPLPQESQPLISVIVPARNESQAIEQTLRSLLAQQGISLEILAVNDRSTDGTGDILDRVAAEARAQGKNISVIHIEALPAGWMGKTHAMALAARQATAPWLLFTDGDIVFREDCLCRAMNYASREADHLVLFPTLILKNFGERMMLSAIQSLSFVSWRPWKIADPKARRDSIGIGAFNLIRSDVYRSIGGFEAQRMEVLEDLRLGYEVKQHNFRQRAVFGRNLIRVHWASGALGIVRNLTKNIFAVFRFRPLLLLAACVALALFCLGPVFGLFGPWIMRAASLLALVSVFSVYRYTGRKLNGASAGYFLVFPVATCLLIYMLLRSMFVTLTRRGVVWRGTFYPLAELREHAGPLR
jgi:glycosyltransferase involved in cell wall biosynthesis